MKKASVMDAFFVMLKMFFLMTVIIALDISI